ncbi:MAG: hypothetical protein KF690_02655 [Bacteroidetes bacterium]|nr:hypothetical protein [Bacteroidota bacterium]
MHIRIVYIFLLLNTGLAPMLLAQYKSQQTIRPVDLSMHVEKPVIQEDVVVLNYNLPYGGVVELKIYDKNRKLMWRNQYINVDGSNRIRFKKTSLRPGNYTLWLLYKGREEEIPLVIPKS